MDPPNPTNDGDEELFFDALDDFPFYDCVVTEQSDQPKSDSKEISSSTTRRRSLSRRRSEISDSNISVGESRSKIHRNLKESEINLDKSSGDRVDSFRLGAGVSEEKAEESTVTFESNERVGNSGDSVDSLGESSQSSSLLVYIAGLVIKAIGFQFNLLISFILFPICVLSFSYMLIMDPCRTIKRGREYLLLKLHSLWNLICGLVGPLAHEWLKGHESIWSLVLRCGWGLFWAIYVCSILCGLLLLALLISGFLMRSLVEEPIQITETLNFDYTANSPVAYVPIISCYGVFCGTTCEAKKELSQSLGSRVIPVNHKLQVTVILTLPESDYNRKLGIFQVRVDFLSANGETLSSSSHPCMLKFKSEPIRLLLTFLQFAPIVAGYVSESQTLHVQLKGFMEGDVPTSCLRVKIEQRAEYKAGVGIPEIYDASLVLESELPLFKRIIWYWKKTIFVWVAMISFLTELFFALTCCRPIILPRARLRIGHTSNSATQNSTPSQT